MGSLIPWPVIEGLNALNAVVLSLIYYLGPIESLALNKKHKIKTNNVKYTIRGHNFKHNSFIRSESYVM